MTDDADTWARLFERGAGHSTDAATIRDRLRDRRERSTDADADDRSDDGGGERPDVSPARVVADADVLAADLLCGPGDRDGAGGQGTAPRDGEGADGDSNPARDALDAVRAHSWVELVASDPLLDDAKGLIAALADEGLASDWRRRIERELVRVDHPPGDHPGLAAAYRGGAAHLLTVDEGLASSATNLTVQPHADLSVRSPAAFAAVFDAAGLYAAVVGGEYPGPDRDPRG